MPAALETLLPGLCGLALSGTAVVLGARTLWTARRSRHWPTVPGRIVAASTKQVRHSHANPGFTVAVQYEYEVGGTRHRGGRIRFGGTSNLNPRQAKRDGQRYPVGARVTVHHDPADPTRCTLEPRVGAIVPVLLAVGALGLVAVTAGLLAG